MKGRVTLMHGEEKVASCYFGKGGILTQIYAVYNMDHMPVVAQGEDNLLGLQKWMNARFTANNRLDLAPYRDFYHFDSRNFTSVMDDYWIKCEKTEKWEDINPYKNFCNDTDELEKMLFFPESMKNEVPNWDSPNLTIPFECETLLCKEDGKFFLLQGNPRERMKDYRLALEKNHPVAERQYVIHNDKLYSRVNLSIDKDTEYIPFEEYFLSYKRDESISHFENVFACCKKYEIPGYEQFFRTVISYAGGVGMRDCKLSDIGVLRDRKTLEIKGFHPLI